MKFNDNCVFKLYDSKINSKFYDKDKSELPEDIYFESDVGCLCVYEIEEGITELLESIYDEALDKGNFTSDYKYWTIRIDFTGNSYDFENAMDALEFFRNKNISGLESAYIYWSYRGVYVRTNFEISYDEGVVKKFEFSGFVRDLEVEVDGEIDHDVLASNMKYTDYLEDLEAEMVDMMENKYEFGSEY